VNSITGVQVGNMDDVASLNDNPSEALPVLREDDAPRKPDALPADFPENARPVGDGSYMLELEYPVTVRFKGPGEEVTTEPYSSLHLRRLTGKMHKQIRDVAPDDFRAQVIASMTELSLGRARLLEDRMDVSDITAVLIVYRFFTTPGRRTGP
jgi:hypothetical protein